MPSLRARLGKEVAAIPRPKIYASQLTFKPVGVFEGQSPVLPIPVCHSSVGSDIVPICVVFSLDTCSPPLVIEAERFPLSVVQHAIDLLNQLAISDNLFQDPAVVRVFGMNYRDRTLREQRPLESADLVVRKRNGTGPLGKSYVEPGPERRKERKSKPQVPSFWDLLYVVLQPPILFEQLDNLYLPHDLFPYQPAGIEFLMKNESALLADEMGTGKTVMTTVALRILMQKGRASRALVVCPLSVLREWKRHLDEWSPELLVTFVRGNKGTRSLDWKMPAHVYVTTYDTLRSDIETGALPKSKLDRFDVVVLDEAQSIKNPASGRSRAVRKLKVSKRWALTGTPVENKLEDIDSLFGFLRPGYLTPFDLYPERIKARIAPFFLRRRKADVLPDLPRKQKQDIWLELDPVQRTAYDQASEEIRSELTALGSLVTKTHIFSRITRLKQICNFAPKHHRSPKLDRLKEQIEEIAASGQKVIVFSQYVGEGINKLENALKPYGIAKIVGEQSESARNREIERFKHSPEVSILLATVRAGGVGLNLTEASYVVHFDHWWNPAVMWQAEARVHRPGQTRGVNVYSYWMSDTIEERIHEILQRKGLLFEDVVDGLSETQIDERISTDEWLEALGVPRKEEARAKPKREAFESLSLVEIREKLQEITPAAFEQLVKELMHSLGYPNVKVTGRTRDGGIDVISTRNTPQGVVRAVAQCKRYRGVVGVEIARQLMGVVASDASIQKGFLVTTGDFSRECLGFCERSGIIVPISGLQVANYVKQFGLAV